MRFSLFVSGLMILLFGFYNEVSAQDKTAELRRAIAYFQQNDFEKSITIFNDLIQAYPDDLNLIERRGYVCCKYIEAIDNNKVKASSERYNEVVKIGLEDLTKAIVKYKDPDIKDCLAFLKDK